MNLQEKVEKVTTELQEVANTFNQLTDQRAATQQRFTELQGSLKTLKELQEEEDGGTDS